MEEITAVENVISSIDDLKKRLADLAVGENVSWPPSYIYIKNQAYPNLEEIAAFVAYPPQETIDELVKYAEELNIHLDLDPYGLKNQKN